jgi:hypothetical protein
MELIRNNRLIQFSPLIQIPPSMLVAGVEKRIELAGLVSALWLPPTWVDETYNINANPAATIIGIRINLQSAPMLPWGLQGNNVSSFTGPVERIFVTLLSGAAAAFTFLAARGIGIGYSGALTAAGTPSTSPSITRVGTL